MTRTLLLPLILLSACMLPVAQSSTGPGATSAPSTSNDPSSSEPSATAAPRSPAAAATPAGPQTASVTIRSSCSKTAPVFYGEKPGFSSGTQSSVSSNSVSSKTFRVGEQMWVLDEAGHPLSSVTIGAGTREIEVTSGCDRLAER